MTQKRPSTSHADEADDALSEVLKLVEQWSIIDDLTENERKEYIKSLAVLDAVVERCRTLARASTASHELISLLAYTIFHAHRIGTYKIPTQSSAEKGVLNVLLTPTAKRPAAEYVDLLEKFDPDFKKQRERMKAQELRDAKSARNRNREDALMVAIKRHLGTDTSKRPAKDADRIVEPVNQDLGAKGFAPVSSATIYRRLLKFPHS